MREFILFAAGCLSMYPAMWIMGKVGRQMLNKENKAEAMQKFAMANGLAHCPHCRQYVQMHDIVAIAHHSEPGHKPEAVH